MIPEIFAVRATEAAAASCVAVSVAQIDAEAGERLRKARTTSAMYARTEA